jgi:hypothetical protein
MDENSNSQIWFRAPHDVLQMEAVCTLCTAPVFPGELVMEDGENFVHETCWEEETTNDIA